jgi:glycine cleavage system H protein
VRSCEEAFLQESRLKKTTNIFNRFLLIRGCIMSVPANYKFTKDHEWVKLENGTATIGITEYAQGELGEVVFVEAADVGKTLTKGDTLCVVESTKAASDVYAPISGTISAGNPELESSPDLVNSSPFEKGWMAKLTNVSQADFDGLMTAAEYEAFCG